MSVLLVLLVISSFRNLSIRKTSIKTRYEISLFFRLTDEFELIDANDVRGFENFLHKYRNVLHSTHYLCLSAKHSLSQLYGKVVEYMIHQMPEAELNRKIDICRDLMKVFDVIEPGYSRLRGELFFSCFFVSVVLVTFQLF